MSLSLLWVFSGLWQFHDLDSLESESESEVAQSCPILCDPMDHGLPGSSVHGILQATILENFQGSSKNEIGTVVVFKKCFNTATT